ncbi:MAG: hypothetical protein LW854_20300 [Rubrivivax sp.]|nr:hypothetical protein [Rubrivivax sp.]
MTHRIPFAPRMAVRMTVLLCGIAALPTVWAQATPAKPGKEAGWTFGGVMDITQTSRPLALGMRDKGLQLGHSDLTAAGPLGPWFRAQLGASFATHDGELEKRVEEAYVETTALPAGLSLRVGRFASQVGYLNQQHMHADDFTERPLLYRAFFGGHWNDDGLRLSWTAPTPFYLAFGAEAFRGKRLVEETAAPARNPGIATLGAKVGADLNREHSVQFGLSYIRNRREAAVEEAHEHEEEAGAEEEHHSHEEHHAHGALFSGRKTWMLDATWKWAPGGNNRGQQLRVGVEAARITGLNRFAGPNDRHQALAVSAVWRFHPSVELGARTDWLRVRVPHEDHFDSARLREAAVMVAWKPTHMQSLRLQATRQWDAVNVENPAKRSVQLQYVMSFGAHGAHSF